jgi:hypothetical protein
VLDLYSETMSVIFRNELFFQKKIFRNEFITNKKMSQCLVVESVACYGSVDAKKRMSLYSSFAARLHSVTELVSSSAISTAHWMT